MKLSDEEKHECTFFFQISCLCLLAQCETFRWQYIKIISLTVKSLALREYDFSRQNLYPSVYGANLQMNLSDVIPAVNNNMSPRMFLNRFHHPAMEHH